MNLEITPKWINICERAFAFNFIAFAFVMFSCWFPTGFSATLSTLAFAFALPIFLAGIKSREFIRFEKTGLLLFGWLFLSVLWSDVSLSESLKYLSEYRIYFILPVLIHVLSLNERTQRLAFFAAMLGLLIALASSYGLALGWLEVKGALNSLANRIYHGFIMASFLAACLLVSREYYGWVRFVFLSLSALIVYNVLNIETGRTGYLQIIVIGVAFCALTIPKRQFLKSSILMILILLFSYLALDRFQEQVVHTFGNVEKMMSVGDYNSSAGYRLEYYRGAIGIALENPILGVGVGDVVNELIARAEAGEMRLLTDNVHSEFLNMLVIGGVPGLLLFCVFIGSIFESGFAARANSRLVGDALICLGLIIVVSALFNSTIKDYGEKHALIVVLSILGARLLGRSSVDNRLKI